MKLLEIEKNHKKTKGNVHCDRPEERGTITLFLGESVNYSRHFTKKKWVAYKIKNETPIGPNNLFGAMHSEG